MARAVEMWSLVLAGSLLAGAGCNREEASTTSAATSAEPPAPPAPPATPAATDLVGYVATYPTMEPQPGRRRLLQQFAVHPSADAQSKELARLDSGALVDLKASYKDWMLVAFQSGGQPTLGWIELKTNDSRATTATDADVHQATATPAPKTADAGAPTGGATGSDAGTTSSDAGATGAGTTPDAGATGDAGAAGTATTPDAGAADGGTGRRRIELKRPVELLKK